MRETIITYSGVQFSPVLPVEEAIRIEDIAHALSLMTRANGHYPQFYSVGQHCLDCALVAKEEGRSIREQLACLLHDASEAYLSDITRPVKAELEEYQRIEKRLQEMIYQKYLYGELTAEERQTVKWIDDACLYHEFLHFKGVALFAKEPQLAARPQYRPCSFGETEAAFLRLFHELSNSCLR